jgi:hypothetical protein
MKILSRNAITLSQAAALLPSNPHVATLYRWSQRGINGYRLVTWKCGGRRYTSKDELENFLIATMDRTGDAPHTSVKEVYHG